MRHRHRSTLRVLLDAALVLALVPVLSACSSLAFYGQAISGQIEVLRKREPIDRVLSRNTTSDELRHKLKLVQEAREFAVTALKLPDNPSYRSYVDLERAFVLWNVFAAPELSLEPVQSCYLFVGCISYRSYFSNAAAERHADSLGAEGYDVYVGGIAAYSTVGWFDDPALNTMLNSTDAWTTKVIFHELAHQRLYVRNDTPFNESFATMVAEEGFARWSQTHHQSGPDNEKKRHDELIALVLKYRAILEPIYSSARADGEKRRLKAATFAALQSEYRELKRTWGGYQAYDQWMTKDLNNAKLGSVATYNDYVPAFKAILGLTGGDVEQFYDVAKHIAQLDSKERDRCLRSVAAGDPSRAPNCIDLAR